MKKFFVSGIISLVFLTGCGTNQQLTPQIFTENLNQVNEVSVEQLNDEFSITPDDSKQNEVSSQGLFKSSRTIRNIVLNVLDKYDHNRSGYIDFRETNTAWKTLIGKNENERIRKYVSGDKVYTTVYTMSKLFLASDKNNDGISTEEEIENYIINTYDKNNDGILQTRGWKIWQDKDEYQIFKSEVGEEVKSHKSRSRIRFDNPQDQNQDINQ